VELTQTERLRQKATQFLRKHYEMNPARRQKFQELLMVIYQHFRATEGFMPYSKELRMFAVECITPGKILIHLIPQILNGLATF
jgi:hypothetical protein